jgi:GLPGLI family protein
MRYTLCLTLLLTLLCLRTHAQTGVLRYRHIETARIVPIHSSIDHTLTFSVRESLDATGESKPLRPLRSNELFVGAHIPGYERLIYKNSKKKQLITRQFGYRDMCVVDDTLHAINWTLRDSTRVIGGYTCRAAEGVCRGRRYFVWYTPDVPVSNGPWKLHGLPGLILEGTDAEHEVAFVFESLEMPAPKNASPTPTDHFKKHRHISFREFEREYEVGDAADMKRRGTRLNTYDGCVHFLPDFQFITGDHPLKFAPTQAPPPPANVPKALF